MWSTSCCCRQSTVRWFPRTGGVSGGACGGLPRRCARYLGGERDRAHVAAPGSPIRSRAGFPEAGISSDPCPVCRQPSGLLHFVWPTQGTITQPFWQYHPSIDIANNYGTPEVAAAAGQVVWSDPALSASLLSSITATATTPSKGTWNGPLVTVGDSVTAGQETGLMGSTGWSTGPHLHFEVTHNGVPQNPLNFLSTSQPTRLTG